MLQDLPDWDPQFMSLIKNTPDGTVNDWLLLFRDPEPKWVSPAGRVTQAGDSAHPFLPTSANGASQAMEDATVLATTLRMGIDHGASVKESLTVYNTLR
jgi:2-polyprenyl-6-methoxyphenol hydroxylase-like FAD-dependent oxidoreductase